jgi:hypothetical protein
MARLRVVSHVVDQRQGCRAPSQFAQVWCGVPGGVDGIVVRAADRDQIPRTALHRGGRSPGGAGRRPDCHTPRRRVPHRRGAGVRGTTTCGAAPTPCSAHSRRIGLAGPIGWLSTSIPVAGYAPTVTSLGCNPESRRPSAGTQRKTLSAWVSPAADPIRPTPIASSTAARPSSSWRRSGRR